MKKEERKAILEEDFRFLNDITIHTVDGQLMLGDNNLPFNVALVMREDEFVKKWIMPFALGNDFGTNYFDVQTWYKLTHRGTQSAMIVDAEDNPVLLVRPLISHNLTSNDFDLLRNVSRHIQQVQADTYRSKDPNASMDAAAAVHDHLEAKRLTITDLVSPEFYDKHGISPAAEKKVYYIKDTINGKTPLSGEQLDRCRKILYADHRKEKVSAEDYLFLKDISKDQFVIDEKISGQEADAAAAVEKPGNPLEC